MNDRLAELKKGTSPVAILNDTNNTLEEQNQMPFFKTARDIITELSNLDVVNMNYDVCKSQLLSTRQKILRLEKEKVFEKYHEQKKNMLDTIIGKFKEKVQILNASKIELNEKLKTEAVRRVKIISPDISDDDLEKASKYPDEFAKKKMMMPNEPDSVILKAFETVQSKYSDIVVLEGQIRELHELFIDFGLLIEDQGDKINKIDQHIIVASNEIDRANNDLGTALDIQRKIRKRQCCICMSLLFCLLILVGIILAIVYETTSVAN